MEINQLVVKQKKKIRTISEKDEDVTFKVVLEDNFGNRVVITSFGELDLNVKDKVDLKINNPQTKLDG